MSVSRNDRYFIYFMLFFYVCGSLNYGLTKIYFVLPLVIPIMFYASDDERLSNISKFIIGIGLLVNLTIFYNPLVFPVLFNPEFSLKSDDYSVTKKSIVYPITGLYSSGGIDSSSRLYIKSNDLNFNADDELIETTLPIENIIIKNMGNFLYFPYFSVIFIIMTINGIMTYRKQNKIKKNPEEFSQEQD